MQKPSVVPRPYLVQSAGLILERVHLFGQQQPNNRPSNLFGAGHNHPIHLCLHLATFPVQPLKQDMEDQGHAQHDVDRDSSKERRLQEEHIIRRLFGQNQMNSY